MVGPDGITGAVIKAVLRRPRVRRCNGAARARRLAVWWAIALGVVGVSLGHAMASAASSACPSGATMAIVAHEDDSILFMNPDLLHDIRAGRCVRTVFVTAGDHGYGQGYWTARELGAEAAYASMAGVADAWTQSELTISGHPMPVMTLTADPDVSLIFMRLPDGNLDGSGFAADGNQSLQKLYTGAIAQITAVDGSSSYTKAGLTSVLTSLMEAFGPDRIDTQDFVGSFGDGDHSDHHAVAYFVRDAHRAYATVTHTLVGYLDYASAGQPADVTGTDFTAKLAAWLAYAAHDPLVCQTAAQCQPTSTWAWLSAEYTVGHEAGGPGVTYPAPTADAGPDQTVPVGATVQLDGSGSSDPDASPSYQWTEIAGPAVTLSSSTALRPTFTAPAGPATVTFALVVTDGQLSSQPATVTVIVSAPPPIVVPPAVSVGGVTVTGPVARVRLACSGTAPAVCDVMAGLTATETVKVGNGTTAGAGRPTNPKTTQKVVGLGDATAELTAGRSQAVKVSLNPAGELLLSRHRTLEAHLTVVQSVAGRISFVAISAIVFKARPGRLTLRHKT
ncbi:MAG: PIG-L family deacetylase [Solirubrobacteraceae bacterium]